MASETQFPPLDYPWLKYDTHLLIPKACFFMGALREREQLIQQGLLDAHDFRTQRDHYIRRADPVYRVFSEWRPPKIQGSSTFDVSYKDVIDVEGFTTRYGNVAGYRHYPEHSAQIAVLLESSRLNCIGKVATTEFSIGLQKPCVNPRFPDFSPSGSSSGSAAAVAAGFCDLSIGTDTVGSVRWPAGNCGIVGLRLTYQPELLSGVFPVAPSLDCLGLLTRTVDDLQYLWEDEQLGALLGKKRLDGQNKSWRLGVPINLVDEHCHPEIVQAFEDLLQALKKQGFSIISVDIPWWHLREHAWRFIAREAYDEHCMIQKQISLDYQPETLHALTFGSTVSDTEYKSLKADQKWATLSARNLLDANTLDALILPLDPDLPEKINKGTQEIRASSFPLNDQKQGYGFTLIASFVGLPALTLPMALSLSGSPIGVQIVGNRDEESKLLQLGSHLEDAIKAIHA